VESVKTADRGFTMLELMAVVAAIAILATLAMLSHFDRIIRATRSRRRTLADIAKQLIAAFLVGGIDFSSPTISPPAYPLRRLSPTMSVQLRYRMAQSIPLLATERARPY
jgi:prepilin-type N-terminal cleavage/methylation domain-containing protein